MTELKLYVWRQSLADDAQHDDGRPWYAEVGPAGSEHPWMTSSQDVLVYERYATHAEAVREGHRMLAEQRAEHEQPVQKTNPNRFLRMEDLDVGDRVYVSNYAAGGARQADCGRGAVVKAKLRTRVRIEFITGYGHARADVYPANLRFIT